MQIGIIGAGNIGGNLTRRLTALGHSVAVANSRGPETLRDLAAETGATAVAADQAATGADLVVLTIPQAKVAGLSRDTLASLQLTPVVVDTGNYYPQQRDGGIAAIEDGATESGWVQEQLGRPVIKAFNGIEAAHLLTHGREVGAPGRRALPVAGDDPTAKAVVLEIVEALGFDAVDAGSLADSWRQQPGTPVYGAQAGREEIERALATASPERTPDWRALPSA